LGAGDVILMNDFRAEPPEIRQAMLAAAERVLASGWYVLGREVEAFERRWAETCGVGYAVGVGNGLDALEIALRSLGVGPGDEVITTPMTAFATVLAILRAGAVPVLADIDPDTALLNLESAQRCLSSRTRALVLVHLYGQIRQMDAWIDFCRAADIELIEDCAQAHLAASRGRVAGSLGRAGAYSFYPTKNLGGIGDGGMVVTGDGELANLAAQLRNYGQSERYYHPHLGLNSRLDELQAALLSERLRWLPEFTARRRHIAVAYQAGIKNPLISQLAEPEEDEAHVYHLYVVTCEYRDALQAHLKDQGVQTLIHYPVPAHKQVSLTQWKNDPLGLPNAEAHAATCLSLPCHPQMVEGDIDRVIWSLNSFN
jgi:dTDP-4-amino-4,6-dideoxygalactose transaminase